MHENLITVSEFRQLAIGDIDRLIERLARQTGRGGDDERLAWRASLPRVAGLFGDHSLDGLHLFFGGRGQIALEYRLPSAPSWCDMVLLGAHQERPSAVILELKDWLTRTDTPGPREGLIRRQGRDDLHPSDQVRGYTEYCRRFHSAIAEHAATVHGCVLFTKDYFCDGYSRPPNDQLSAAFPLFTLSKEDAGQRLPAFLKSRIDRPNEVFATAFAEGVYRQDRGFVRMVAAQLSDPSSSPLELLDGQRRALAICQARTESALFESPAPRKTVIVVEGPPGSGKSVVAARLWSALLTDARLPNGNVTFVTTSTAQTSNWRSLFHAATNEVAARGIVVTANEYVPFTTQDVNQAKQRFPGLLGEVSKWRENYLATRNAMPERHRTPDDHFLVSIVDEGHALVNPEHADGRGQYGFAVNFGPQAYHIIRASTVSVFFLDERQSFRDQETTTIGDLRAWASDLGADFVGPIGLAGAQFRCGGSQRFMDWVDEICSIEPPRVGGAREPRSTYLDSRASAFEAHVCGSVFDLEELLRGVLIGGQSARLVASYARPWRTKKVLDPHALPETSKDFLVQEKGSTALRAWSKVWNVVPGGRDYTMFVTAPAGTAMGSDCLSEVGCPYVVRGFDFDWIGLLWFSDVVWRKGRWVTNLDHVHESGLKRHKMRASAESDPNGPQHLALLRQLLLGYRILLTRAMRGIAIWIEDDETRLHVQASLRDWQLITARDPIASMFAVQTPSLPRARP